MELTRAPAAKKASSLLLKCKLYTLIKTNKLSEIIDLIKVYGFDYDYFDDKITFLTLAIMQGNADILRVIINAGANLNLLSHISYTWPDNENFNNFETALITATREGLYDLCKLLLNSNVNVNKTDSFQMSALHWACELDHVDLVELLIQHRACFDCVDLKGCMPIELCVLKNNQDSFDYLINNCNVQFCFYKLLFLSVENFNHEMLRSLLNKLKSGEILYDINQINDTVGSLLHYAVILSNFDKKDERKQQTSYLQTVEILLKHGIEVNLANKLGETPLHLCRNCTVVDLLLAYGAQMNLKEITGKTPLFKYFCNANYDMCLELIKHGSEYEIADRFGNSLLYAVIHSNAPLKFLRLLLEAGVCLHNEKWFNEKLFPLTLRKKHPRVIKFIEWRSRNPLSLKELCRKNIRSYLSQVNRNTSVLKRVEHLPVPVCLQDYILFNLK